MSELTHQIEQWFQEKPKWLQDATVRIIEKGELTSDDFPELVGICKSEANILPFANRPNLIKTGDLDFVEEFNNLRLNSISDIKGINALSPRKPLVFNDGPMTIIYGRNGSGKSGYTRALKHACGARAPGKLLHNVFGTREDKKSCVFKIAIGSKIKDIRWDSSTGICEELRTIEIYDSECATVYVNDENEVTYEPGILLLFTQLVEACNEVDKILKNNSNMLISKKAKMPEIYVSTNLGKWYDELTYKTSCEEINTKCHWTEKLEEELVEKKARLLQKNPTEVATSLRRSISNIENLLRELDSVRENLSDTNCEIFLLAKADATLKRITSNEYAQNIFKKSVLAGVGTATWKLLWESARNYSKEIAYSEKPFPNVDSEAKCLLCQQTINEDAKLRLISFENYVKGDIEKHASESEIYYEDLKKQTEDILLPEVLGKLIDSAGIFDEKECSQILQYYHSFELRKNSLFDVKEKAEVTKLPSIDNLEFINKKIGETNERARIHELDSKKENREILQVEVNELETQKWMFQQKNIVEDEINRLTVLEKYKYAQSLVSTKGISDKKSLLSDILISGEYKKRFEDELKLLGASKVQVEIVKTRTAKGHVYHQIKLKGCPKEVHTCDVLSEGELRIVSLAGFLADTEGRPNFSTFIFDDPISSLDQDYEEAAARRLVKLCKKRQVIVFTHRLSMLALLEDALDKESLKTDEPICLRSECWGVGEPGDIPFNISNPEKALKNLLNERVVKAKKIFQEEGKEKYEAEAKSICSDFRVLLERIIEKELLVNVINRFRRQVKTKGIICGLAKITKEDCKLFDDLMTKYSIQEHSQPDETPIDSPEPSDLQSDIETVHSWIMDFRKRVNAL